MSSFFRKNIYLILVLAISSSSYALGNLGTGLIAGGIGYLFGKKSGSSNSKIYNSTKVHVTNKTNIYIDTKGIERGLSDIAEETRLAGPNYTLLSEDKRDYKSYYHLDEVGPMIGVDIDSADTAVFVQNFGKPELQKTIEDRIRRKALTMVAVNGVLESLKSDCTESVSQNVIDLFNVPELVSAIEVRTGINTYSSAFGRWKFDILSENAKAKGISPEVMDQYFEQIISTIKTWLDNDVQNISFLDLKNYAETEVVSSDLLVIEKHLMDTKSKFFNGTENVSSLEEYLNNRKKSCKDLVLIAEEKNREIEEFQNKIDLIIQEHKLEEERLQARVDELGLESGETKDDVILAREEVKQLNPDLISDVKKAGYDWIGAQEYIVTKKDGKKFSVYLNSEESGANIKARFEKMVKESLTASYDTFLYNHNLIRANDRVGSSVNTDYCFDMAIIYNATKAEDRDTYSRRCYGMEPFGISESNRTYDLDSSNLWYVIVQNTLDGSDVLQSSIERVFKHVRSRNGKENVSGILAMTRRKIEDLENKKVGRHYSELLNAGPNKLESCKANLASDIEEYKKRQEAKLSIDAMDSTQCVERSIAQTDDIISMLNQFSVEEGINEPRSLEKGDQRSIDGVEGDTGSEVSTN